MTVSSPAQRASYARVAEPLPMPDLVLTPVESYAWLQKEGLRELFDEISPIVSHKETLELHFPGLDDELNRTFGLGYRFGEPNRGEKECRLRGETYSAPLYASVLLYNRELDQPIVQEIFLASFPLMTSRASFIVNGTERVVVGQLIRSPGPYFSLEEHRSAGQQLCVAKLIPDRGAWLRIDTSRRDVISAKIDRKRKLPVSVLLRSLALVSDGIDDVAIGDGTDDEILALTAMVDDDPLHRYMPTTLERDDTASAEGALQELYHKMRPGDPATLEHARSYLESLFFDPRRYDLGRVGRYRLSRLLGTQLSDEHRTLTKRDLVGIVIRVIQVNNGLRDPDDMDHLANRRIRSVGELVRNQLRVGFLRMERIVKQRMSTRGSESISPLSLVNARPIVGALNQFFARSQLSQLMMQTNALDELTHKRTLSALGPGGLKRQHAGFEVRDVHFTHFGRLCPIETPEGPNIGLILRLATYATVNGYGFVETPYRTVKHRSQNDPRHLLGRTLDQLIVDPETSEEVARPGDIVDRALASRLQRMQLDELQVRPYATQEIAYFSADGEIGYVIAQASSRLDELGQFVDDRVAARAHEDLRIVNIRQVTHMGVSPKQIVGVSASLVPFLEHDDANRALMGANMQRQAVPLVSPEAPLVGTGMEGRAAVGSGQLVTAPLDGIVVGVTDGQIVIRGDDKLAVRNLRKFDRSNQFTCINERPMVTKGERVHAGAPIADGSTTSRGELALGRNVLVAFMSWEGANYEDAIAASEELVRDDTFTSIHIKEYSAESRDARLGQEEITRDIPNVSQESLRSLDEDGTVYLGAKVHAGDVLVGKITPKGQTTLSPEEKLVRAIFGEKAQEVRDSSLRLPHGEAGVVTEVRTYTRDDVPGLKAGIQKKVIVTVARRLKLSVGDKLAGRHGNKGVVSRIVSTEDMPFLEDGTPVQMILNPLGVPGRMNLGQVLETHLGWAASRLGLHVETPVSDGASEDEIFAALARAWLIDRAWSELSERAWTWTAQQGIDTEQFTDDSAVRDLYLGNYMCAQGLTPQQIDEWLSGETRRRRMWLRFWLEEQGYGSDSLMPDEEGNNRLEVRHRADERARDVCLHIWLQDQGEMAEGLSSTEVAAKAVTASMVKGLPLPTSGKMVLHDAKTGEPYDRPVTVGIMYMLKLIHIVQDKAHARSTGPYSLVTQQPLGGKAQFGGQRLGEMEVWALEAHGAAHTLQEMLTIKSDDTTGRVEAYQAISKGEPVNSFGVPESFRVMLKELQALGLSVEVMNGDGSAMDFGQNGHRQELPELGFGTFSRRLRTRH